MPTPKVSIVIPVYNAEKTLSKCINSLLIQTFKYFELILINDGSKDRSLDICKDFAKKDNRIKVYNKSNGGVSSARNLGIDSAKGEWLIFVDSDDWVDPDYCQNLLSSASHPLSFVMSRHDFIGKQSSIIKDCNNISGEERIDFIISNKILDFSGPYCKLFNLKTLNNYNIRFPENIHMGEDGIFFVKYLNATKSLTVLNINNYHYQNNNQSLSHKFYDFQSEYYCYKIWKQEIEILFKNKYWESMSDLQKCVWDNRIGDTFMRCILCLSRKNTKLSMEQIFNNLRTISNSDWKEFKRHYHPTTFQRKIIKKIFSFKILPLDLIVILIDRIINGKQLY